MTNEHKNLSKDLEELSLGLVCLSSMPLMPFNASGLDQPGRPCTKDKFLTKRELKHRAERKHRNKVAAKSRQKNRRR